MTKKKLINELIYWGLGTPVVLVLGFIIYLAASLVDLAGLIVLLFTALLVALGFLCFYLFDIWQDAAYRRMLGEDNEK